MPFKQLRRYCPLVTEYQWLMRTAMDELGLSARAHDRIRRMARTIADFAGEAHLRPEHLSEVIGYRSLDRQLWAR